MECQTVNQQRADSAKWPKHSIKLSAVRPLRSKTWCGGTHNTGRKAISGEMLCTARAKSGCSVQGKSPGASPRASMLEPIIVAQ
eukprot:443574-Prymnesium_polylepis.1